MVPKDVTIRTVLNGWVVTVGCQQVVFTKLKDLLDEIVGYLDNPADVEAVYREHSVNSRFFTTAPPEQQPTVLAEECVMYGERL